MGRRGDSLAAPITPPLALIPGCVAAVRCEDRASAGERPSGPDDGEGTPPVGRPFAPRFALVLGPFRKTLQPEYDCRTGAVVARYAQSAHVSLEARTEPERLSPLARARLVLTALSGIQRGQRSHHLIGTFRHDRPSQNRRQAAGVHAADHFMVGDVFQIDP